MSEAMDIVITSGPIEARHGIGGNNPPKTPFEIARDEIEALFEEAGHWLDGKGVNNAAEEHNVDELMDLLRKAEKSADAARKTENEPFDTGKAEVQARFNPILAKAKLAIETCKKALAPYRQKLADEKTAIAAKAAADAAAKRKEAEDAFRASQVTDLAQRAAAEALLKEADKADKAASKAEKAATTGLGLRTTYRTEITDQTAFARYVWTNHQSDLAGFLADLAPKLVARGLREMPGVTVTEEKVAI